MLRTQLKKYFSFTCNNLKKEVKKTGLVVDMESSTLVFGQDFSSHMAEVNYCDQIGWSDPIIKPMENLQLHPACQGIHYALSCFEGKFKNFYDFFLASIFN